MSKLQFEEETYTIRGAIFEVYKEMGCGFLEAVYQECLAKEFRLRGIPFVEHPRLSLTYKGQPLEQTYAPDFLAHEGIVVELKAVRELAPEHVAQVLNYLKATGHRLALLVNFGSHPQVQIERYVR
jgi:GxxExxY protein